MLAGKRRGRAAAPLEPRTTSCILLVATLVLSGCTGQWDDVVEPSLSGEGDANRSVSFVNPGLVLYELEETSSGPFEAYLVDDRDRTLLLANTTQTAVDRWAVPVAADTDHELEIRAHGNWTIGYSPLAGTEDAGVEFPLEGQDRWTSRPIKFQQEGRYNLTLQAQDKGEPLWADLLAHDGSQVAVVGNPNASGERVVPTPRTETTPFSTGWGAHVLRVHGEGDWTVDIEMAGPSSSGSQPSP